MKASEYNSEIFPKISHAQSFLHCLDHALDKAGENAQVQVRVIGWNDELKQFLSEAVEHYANYLREQIE